MPDAHRHGERRRQPQPTRRAVLRTTASPVDLRGCRSLGQAGTDAHMDVYDHGPARPAGSLAEEAAPT
ncbi:hypothetical protein ACGFX8_26330 [Streptomyces sp. NPDC048362]|uniref:hypothetical protein n=1 Tax=Streptomyces sp. NPDC048362 TaxID=3365539 RepID=UPI00371C5B50